MFLEVIASATISLVRTRFFLSLKTLNDKVEQAKQRKIDTTGPRWTLRRSQSQGTGCLCERVLFSPSSVFSRSLSPPRTISHLCCFRTETPLCRVLQQRPPFPLKGLKTQISSLQPRCQLVIPVMDLANKYDSSAYGQSWPHRGVKRFSCGWRALEGEPCMLDSFGSVGLIFLSTKRRNGQRRAFPWK